MTAMLAYICILWLEFVVELGKTGTLVSHEYSSMGGRSVFRYCKDAAAMGTPLAAWQPSAERSEICRLVLQKKRLVL